MHGRLGWAIVLERVLELADCWVRRNMVGEIDGTQELLGEEGVNVATQTAGVIAKAVRSRVRFDLEGRIHGGH